MKIFVGVTDNDWYWFLRARPHLDEVNFWQPSGSSRFRALDPGGLFLFKLHAPENYIAGGGFFAHFSLLPYRTAWEFFDEKNGVRSVEEMRRRISKYRREDISPFEDATVGCIMLVQPFFFPESDWIPVPEDFSLNIVRGKGYDTAEPIGMKLWKDVQLRIRGSVIAELPEGGRHETCNGLLLRSDIHRLYDRGYVTVTPDHSFHVSGRLKTDFDNGEPYYPLEGNEIFLPGQAADRPRREFLEWHADTVFRR